MNSINNAFINALLAEASYVNLKNEMDEDEIRIALNRNALTLPQAQYIANNFEVISAINTNDLMGSGFDAVVWRGRAGGEFAGQVFVSTRGTEPGGMDLFDADIDLATRGVAYSQVRDMVNWWMSATAKPGEMVKQIAVLDTSTSVPMPEATGYKTFVAGTPVPATGELYGQVNAITAVNGHSLGGYLATVFTRLFGQSVNEVQTFNSAGLTHASFTNLEAEIARLVGAQGIAGLGLSSFEDVGSKQSKPRARKACVTA